MENFTRKWKEKFSNPGIVVGLALTLPALIASGICALLALRITESEIRANIQQSIGDSSYMMAIHFKDNFEDLIDTIQKEAENDWSLLKKSEEKSKSSAKWVGKAKPPFETVVLTTRPEILDLSIWQRTAPEGVFVVDSVPERKFLGLNNKFPAFTMDRLDLITGVSEAEKQLINPAFMGRTVIALAPEILGVRKFITFAVPLGRGPNVEEIAVAHVNVDRIQGTLRGNGMVSAVLVDEHGKILVRSVRDGKSVEHVPGLKELLLAAKKSALSSGQILFTDNTSNSEMSFFGGFKRVGVGQTAVLASISEEEGMVALRILKSQLMAIWCASFLVFFTLGYRLARYLQFKPSQVFSKNKKENLEFATNPEELATQMAQTAIVVALHASLRNFEKLLEAEGAESVTESMNDYLTIASNCAKQFGGIFEKVAGGQSFSITWGAFEKDHTEVWRALRCALELRMEFKSLNQLRHTDGLKSLVISMGLHSGSVLVSRIGAAGQISITILGEALSGARGLSQIAAVSGKDLLISNEVWIQSEGKFVGDLVGEGKLSPETGLVNYFTIYGYRNEQGEQVDVPAPVLEQGLDSVSPEPIHLENKKLRWLINNGSQIVGPFTPKEISSRLFAQELDFDCECWQEGVGTSSQLKTAGIFSGSQDSDSRLWLFDGEMVHGPMTPGFLRTAIGHGAMPKDAYICEETTINGWQPLEAWEKKIFEEAKFDKKAA